MLFLVQESVRLPLDYVGGIVRYFGVYDSQTIRGTVECEVDTWPMGYRSLVHTIGGRSGL